MLLIKGQFKYSNLNYDSRFYINLMRERPKTIVAPELGKHLIHMKSVRKYILEASLWWGGFWKYVMTNLKRAFKKILGKSKQTCEDVVIVSSEIEGKLNSRSVRYMYEYCTKENMTYPI